MKNWIIRWVVSALALYVITLLHIGVVVDNPITALVVVVVLGFVNSLIRPIIMFFVWPINCMTFGLMGFVVNVALFLAVGSGLIHGFAVHGWKAAFIGSILMGFLSGLFNFVLKDRGDRDED